MAENIKKITDTLIIPAGSSEIFINPTINNEHALLKSGILQAGISQLKPNYRIIRQFAPFHVLLYCTAGKGEVTEHGITKKFSKDDLVFIPGQGSQNYGSNKSFSMVWLHLQPKHKRLNFLGEPQLKVWPAYNNQLETLFNFLYGESNSPDGIDINIIQSCGELICRWLERESKSKETQISIRHRRKLNALWLSVSEDLSYPWTINTLSQRVFLSPQHLHSITQELFNNTPMGMVTQLRLIKVQYLLQNTDLKLHSIAQMVGYQSPFSLSRIFKKHFGYSPKAMRSSKPT
jgi:AraC-like DNA-binding protein/quercetin dioxygenase-like cupin family protein